MTTDSDARARHGLPRRWILAAGSAGIIAVFGACGSPAPDGVGSGADTGNASAGACQEEVTLGLAWWGSDYRHTYFQEIIDIYEQDNENIDIEPTYAGFEDYWDRVATSVAGGSAPDVMAFDFLLVREYADRGALVDLSEYLGSVIDSSGFDPAMVGIGASNGSTWAIPTGAAPFTMLANKTVFEQAGIALPDDESWTYDDYLDVASSVSAATPEGTYGTMTTDLEPSLEIFLRQRGESLFTDAGEVGFKAETAKEWWDFQQALVESGAAPPPSVQVEEQVAPIDASLMAQNQAALSEAFINYMVVLGSTSGSDIVPLMYPGETSAEQPGLWMKPAQMWAISSASECPAEAAKLLDFLLNDPRVADLMLADRGLPINLELRDQVVGQLSEADRIMAEYMNTVSPSLADPPSLPPPGGKAEFILVPLSEKVLFGQMSTAEAAETLVRDLKASIGQE